MANPEKKHIGSFNVASGQWMIGDPCYLRQFENDELDFRNLNENEYSYSGVWQIADDGGGTVQDGLAVAGKSGYGDGQYDVYATYHDDRLIKIEVDFV